MHSAVISLDVFEETPGILDAKNLLQNYCAVPAWSEEMVSFELIVIVIIVLLNYSVKLNYIKSYSFFNTVQAYLNLKYMYLMGTLKCWENV